MFDFRIIISRYNPEKCQRRQSAPILVKADSFFDATTRANDMVRGMTAADRVCDYKIASVAQEGLGGEHGYFAGNDPFETQEEAKARCEAEQ